MHRLLLPVERYEHTLPPAMILLLQPFAPHFTRRVWNHVQVLLAGAILAPAQHTVAATLRVRGLSGDPSDIQGFVVGTASTSGKVAANKDEVYTPTYKATDNAGNSATIVVTITVPHDQGHS